MGQQCPRDLRPGLQTEPPGPPPPAETAERFGELQSPEMRISHRELDFCGLLLSVCIFTFAIVYLFLIASVNINVGRSQRWNSAASSVNRSSQQRDTETTTNSLSKRIIAANLQLPGKPKQGIKKDLTNIGLRKALIHLLPIMSWFH